MNWPLCLGVFLVFFSSGGILPASSAVNSSVAPKPLTLEKSVRALSQYHTSEYGLRLLKETDYARMREILQHPDAVKMSGDAISDAGVRALIQLAAKPSDRQNNWSLFCVGITEKNTQELIGLIQLYYRQPNGTSASIGFNLLRSRWGKEIMPRVAGLFVDFAFKELKLDRIDATSLQSNIKAHEVLDRLGFKRSGTRAFPAAPELLDNVYFLTPGLRGPHKKGITP